MSRSTLKNQFEQLEDRRVLSAVSLQPARMNRSQIAEVHEVELVDFDADGDFDVVSLATSHNGDRGIYYHENFDGTSFRETRLFAEIEDTSYGLAAHGGAVPADQHISWLTPSDDNVVTVFLWNASTRWARPFQSSVTAIDLPPQFANIDDNSPIDLLYGNRWYPTSHNGGNRFGPSGPVVTRTGDFNGDGTIDAIGYYPESFGGVPRIGVYGNIAHVREERLIGVHDLGSEIRDFVVADFDGDGDADLATVSDSKDVGVVLDVFLSHGQGYDFRHSVHSERELSLLKLADVDLDGDIDLAAMSIDDLDMIWLENEDAIFSEPKALLTARRAQSDFDIADIDRDGVTDVVIGSKVEGTFIVPARDDNRAVQFVSNPGVGAKAILHATDYDGDGFEDLISASIRSEQILFHRSIGNGEFANPWLLAEDIGNVVGFELADFDNDGDTDFLLTRADTGRILWMEQPGIGLKLIPHPVGRRLLKPGPASAADVDADGDVDIVSWRPGGRSVSWYRNDSQSQGFFGPIEIESGMELDDVTVLDADGDGDKDLVLSGKVDGKAQLVGKWNEIGFERFFTQLIRDRNAAEFVHFAVPIAESSREQLIVQSYFEGVAGLQRLQHFNLANPADVRRNVLRPDDRELIAFLQTDHSDNIFDFASSHFVSTSKIGTTVFFVDDDTVAARPFIIDDHTAYSVASSDFDSDGDIDLAVSTDLGIRLLRNESPLPLADFNFDGVRDAHDMDELCTAASFFDSLVDLAYDFNSDGMLNSDDLYMYRRLVFNLPIGDSNADGVFDSSDLVQVFQSNRYETGRIASWTDGDWNCDRRFDSQDVVRAFDAGSYRQPADATRRLGLVAAAIADFRNLDIESSNEKVINGRIRHTAKN